MRIPVFLSYPQPHLSVQIDFIQGIEKYLQKRGLEPRTLGVTDYDMDAPLKAIRRLMLESNGLVTIAFKRTYIAQAEVRKGANTPDSKQTIIEDSGCRAHTAKLNQPWRSSSACQY